MKCLKCGTEFSAVEITMIIEDSTKPICDLCAVNKKNE